MDKLFKQTKRKIIRCLINNINHMDKVEYDYGNFVCHAGKYHRIRLKLCYILYDHLDPNNYRRVILDLNLWEYLKLFLVFRKAYNKIASKKTMESIKPLLEMEKYILDKIERNANG